MEQNKFIESFISLISILVNIIEKTKYSVPVNNYKIKFNLSGDDYYSTLRLVLSKQFSAELTKYFNLNPNEPEVIEFDYCNSQFLENYSSFNRNIYNKLIISVKDKSNKMNPKKNFVFKFPINCELYKDNFLQQLNEEDLNKFIDQSGIEANEIDLCVKCITCGNGEAACCVTGKECNCTPTCNEDDPPVGIPQPTKSLELFINYEKIFINDLKEPIVNPNPFD